MTTFTLLYNRVNFHFCLQRSLIALRMRVGEVTNLSVKFPNRSILVVVMCLDDENKQINLQMDFCNFLKFVYCLFIFCLNSLVLVNDQHNHGSPHIGSPHVAGDKVQDLVGDGGHGVPHHGRVLNKLYRGKAEQTLSSWSRGIE